MEAVTAAAVFAAAAGVAIAYSSQQKAAGPAPRALAAGRSDLAAATSSSVASAPATVMHARPTAHGAKAVLPAASAGDVLLHPIDHLDAFGADLPTFTSPLISRSWPRLVARPFAAVCSLHLAGFVTALEFKPCVQLSSTPHSF